MHNGDKFQIVLVSVLVVMIPECSEYCYRSRSRTSPRTRSLCRPRSAPGQGPRWRSATRYHALLHSLSYTYIVHLIQSIIMCDLPSLWRMASSSASAAGSSASASWSVAVSAAAAPCSAAAWLSTSVWTRAAEWDDSSSPSAPSSDLSSGSSAWSASSSAAASLGLWPAAVASVWSSVLWLGWSAEAEWESFSEG